MQSKCFQNVTLLAFWLALIWPLQASSPEIKIFDKQEDFQNGKPTGISINHLGELTLAPAINEVFKSDLPFLWAGASDSRGNIYVGGGNSGQVYKIDKQGNAAIIFEADEVHIYSLAVDDNDNLFVASSPNGKVYKISAEAKTLTEGTVLFDPPDIYIWSLAFDRKGDLFVATGETGKIYKVDKNGNAAVFYESGDAHVRKIVVGPKGDLIVGTANKGIVVRVDDSGKAFVIYDSPLTEITALFASEDGTVYAAATGEAASQARPQVRRQSSQEEDPDDEDSSDLAQEDVVRLLQPVTAGDRSQQQGELYRISPDGTVRTYQTPISERIYAMTARKSGALLLGAGDDGRLYAMTPDADMSLLAKLQELQITLLQKDASGKIFIGTSNTGKLYQLSDQFSREGAYVSEVIDTGVNSQWGSVNWEAEVGSDTAVRIQTRTGNTEEPDRTWSAWSAAYAQAGGQAIESPPARFFQFKITLTSNNGRQSPRLRQFSFSYLQKNIAPEIKQVRIHPPGEYYPEASGNANSNSHLGESSGNGKNGFQKASFGRKAHQKGYRACSWIVQDENKDKQSYDLYYKLIDSKNWKVLVEDFTGKVYSWDSELMPDGEYLVKLVARDDGSNPPARVLSSEKVSEPFIVDNTGPEVSEIQVVERGSDKFITFTVRDALSKVKSAEYGLNAEKWELVYPVDSICDSKTEKFEIKVSSKLNGNNSIVIKALDSNDNIGYGKGFVNL